MRHFIAVFVALIVAADAAAQSEIEGVWGGMSTAAMSIYGTLTIGDGHMSWGRNANYPSGCRVEFSVESEPPGVKFKAPLGTEYVTGPNAPFVTHLLKVRSSTCAHTVAAYRFTIMSDQPSRLEMIDYDSQGEALGWMSFVR